MEYSIRQVELNHMNRGLMRAVKDTLGIFRDAVRCLAGIVSAEWDRLSGLNSREQLTAVERLIHTTKNNRAVYPEFDQKFYKFPSYYRLRRLSRMSGKGQPLSAFYSKLDGLKNNYTKQLASWIVRQAVQCGVYGIAMEYLGRMKPHGKKKDRIHHWCRRRIYALVRGMALRHGIRVFLVNPKNTSVLAFDGSGPVKRDEHNFSLCTFATGKRYHCDLGASYNISARYFIRAFCKSMPETAWSRCVAEVPALAKRTSCTLSDLWKLNRYLHPVAKAA